MVFFSSGFLQDFFFIFYFLQFEYICLSVGFSGIYLSFLDHWSVIQCKFKEVSIIIASNISSVSFFYLCYFHYMKVTPLGIVPPFLEFPGSSVIKNPPMQQMHNSWIFCSFFKHLSLFDLVLKVSIDIIWSSRIFFWAVLSPLVNPSKSVFISVKMFLVFSVSFRFFLRTLCFLLNITPLLLHVVCFFH